MRVTQNMLDRNLLYGMAENFERLARLNEQLSTGRRVNTVSDDPLATRQILQTQRANGYLQACLGNMASVDSMLSFATSALQRVSETMTRIKELGTQAATGTYTDAQRQSMAEGVDQLLGNLLTLGNTDRQGDYVFSGEATDVAPFVAATDESGRIESVSYQGAVISTEVQVGPAKTSEINLVGKEIFERGGSVFETVIALRDAISAGDEDEINNMLGELETRHVAITTSLGRLGERQSQLQALRGTFESFVDLNTEFIAGKQDADIPALATAYTRQMTLLQMVMQVAAQALKPSLLNFL